MQVLFLYFDDMNWPLWHAGLACAVGLLGRMGFQQIQLHLGIEALTGCVGGIENPNKNGRLILLMEEIRLTS